MLFVRSQRRIAGGRAALPLPAASQCRLSALPFLLWVCGFVSRWALPPVHIRGTSEWHVGWLPRRSAVHGNAHLSAPAVNGGRKAPVQEHSACLPCLGLRRVGCCALPPLRLRLHTGQGRAHCPNRPRVPLGSRPRWFHRAGRPRSGPMAQSNARPIINTALRNLRI